MRLIFFFGSRVYFARTPSRAASCNVSCVQELCFYHGAIQTFKGTFSAAAMMAGCKRWERKGKVPTQSLGVPSFAAAAVASLFSSTLPRAFSFAEEDDCYCEIVPMRLVSFELRSCQIMFELT